MGLLREYMCSTLSLFVQLLEFCSILTRVPHLVLTDIFAGPPNAVAGLGGCAVDSCALSRCTHLHREWVNLGGKPHLEGCLSVLERGGDNIGEVRGGNKRWNKIKPNGTKLEVMLFKLQLQFTDVLCQGGTVLTYIEVFCPLQWQHACSSLDFNVSFDPLSSPKSATEKAELLVFILNTGKLSWFEQVPQEVKEPGLSQLGLQILYHFCSAKQIWRFWKFFLALWFLCYVFVLNVMFFTDETLFFFKGLKITCFMVTELFVFFVLDNSGKLLRVLNHSAVTLNTCIWEMFLFAVMQENPSVVLWQK